MTNRQSPTLIDTSQFLDNTIENTGPEEDEFNSTSSRNFERNQSTISSLLILYLRICDCNFYNLTTLLDTNNDHYSGCNENTLIVFESDGVTNNSNTIKLDSFTKLLGLNTFDSIENKSLIFHVNNITIHCQSLSCIQNNFNTLKLPIIDVIKVNETLVRDSNFSCYLNQSYDISIECCAQTYGEITFKINVSTHTSSGNFNKCIDELFVIDIAVYTGSLLSLLGLISIFTSAILIKDWFKKRMLTLQLSLNRLSPTLIDTSQFPDNTIEKTGPEEDEFNSTSSPNFELNQSTISSLLILYLRICNCNFYNLTTLLDDKNDHYSGCNENTLIVFESDGTTNNSNTIKLDSFTKLLGLNTFDSIENKSLIFHVNNITIHCQSLSCIQNNFNTLKLPIIDVIKVNETLVRDSNFSCYLNQSYDISIECCAQTYGEITFKINVSTHTSSVFDATPKIPYGLLTGNLMEPGNYDGCLRVRYDGEYGRVLGKYCGMSVAVILPIHLTMDDQIQTTSLERRLPGDSGLSLKSGLPMQPETGYRILVTSVCIPSACEPSEVLEFLYITNVLPLVQTVDTMECETSETTPEFTGGDIGFIVFISIVLAFVVICTVYDEVIRDKNRTAHPLYVAFSLKRNFLKIVEHSKNDSRIGCLDGLRVFSILWVILGHRFSISEILPWVNADYSQSWRRSTYTQYAQGASSAVDTFMFLTGLLMAMSFVKTHSKPKSNFNLIVYYVHRYLRLTPAAAVTYFLHVSLFMHMGNGPFWQYLTQRTRDNCLDRWSSFFFYYQNYLDHNNMCLLHTWYLSMDMQIFILSPMVLFPLAKRTKLMMRAGLPILIALSMACPFIITYYYETEIFSEAYYTYYYYPTHTRLSPWLIGVFTGAILHVYKDKKLAIHPIINLSIWLVVIVGMVACVFLGNNVTYNYDRLATSFYLTFYRPAWCVGLAWVVIACSKGRGGIFEFVLSADIFQMLAKLTYSMYLVHVTCLLLNVARTRFPGHFGDQELIHLFLGDMLMTMTLGIVWCVLFESPLVAVERFVFGTPRKGKKPRANGTVNAKDDKGIEGIKVVGKTDTTDTHEFNKDPLKAEEEIANANNLRAMQDNNEAEYILPEDVNSRETGEDTIDASHTYNEIVNYNNAMTRNSLNDDDESMKIDIEAGKGDDNFNDSTESLGDGDKYMEIDDKIDDNSVDNLGYEDEVDQVHTNSAEKARE
ncbi:o-acyltransferase [Holotrichia oblita]|uniref:O-acyltransferase n=1 Tax=Holotrichia oblita TaxID=644536 RepID=A0ACB9TAV7_HOLOL|nr:o-acyltransferase [Holotrichia oblita]